MHPEPPPPTHLYINTESTSQTVTILNPGTAQKGRIDFGDIAQGTRRLKAGDKLTLLKQISQETAICTLENDTAELLIYTPHIRPL
jgi:hypothetical protein